MCDTDGHATAWTVSGSEPVTETQEWPNNGQTITTSEGWDSNNDLVSTTDANDNTTQYGYDVGGSGNMVEMLLPQMSDITGGPLSPLSYYSYDNYHNVVAYCDPVYNQTHHKSWSFSPGNNLCPGGNGTTALTYPTPGSEPFGCLTSITKPSAYVTNISYGSGTDQCGVGLPTQVQAAQPIPQPSDISRQPTQDFGYTDGKGNLTNYDKGMGDSNHYQDSWSLTYDAENLNESRTENEPTIPGAQITSYTCYYLDGSILYTETPWQHAHDNGSSCPDRAHLESGKFTVPTNATAYSYDTDGDQVQIVDHKGGSTGNMGTTIKWYDGLDRLVETMMPQDKRLFPNQSQTYDCYKSNPWMTRYIYDLSGQGGTARLHIGGVTGLAAYGGLYKTEEYLPNEPSVSLCPAGQTLQWTDVRGSSFDGLDRVLDKYELDFGTDPKTINIYDGMYELGLLSESENTPSSGTHQTISYTYDDAARVKEVDFGGVGPQENNRTYTFDADGRTATITDTQSLGTISYVYDLDGNITSESDPSNENNASTTTYTNYPDGLREYLSISPTNGPGTGPINKQDILSYSYREDGRLHNEGVNWSQSQGTFTWSTRRGVVKSPNGPAHGRPRSNVLHGRGGYSAARSNHFGIQTIWIRRIRARKLTESRDNDQADQMQYDADD